VAHPPAQAAGRSRTRAVWPVSGIKITGTGMSSAATPHTAMAAGDGWEVSWLPGRTLTRNEAITAMVIANIVGDRGVGLAEDPIWPHLDGWAGELGLSAADAVARISEPPTPASPAAPGNRTAGPPGGARLCAHADRDGQGAHWLQPGATCEAETGQQPEAGA
jgi:hypothetical protein